VSNLAINPVRLVQIQIPNHDALYELPASLDIVDANDTMVRILVTDPESILLHNIGYKPRTIIADYKAWLDSNLQNYRTFAQVCSIMHNIALTHPEICRLDTIGLTARNHEILALRITDNPKREKPEPEIRIIGVHHGDEKIATEICLEFADFLAESYDTSSTVHTLINSREIWVIPILNADGHIANTRRNGNNVDINRDYGYKWDQRGNSTRPFSQPETKAIRQHSIENNITLEFAYHSVQSYVNYLWDNHRVDPPDSGYILALAQRYADSTYGSRTTRLTPINGYDWYAVYGSCQDADFGLWGTLSYTIETRQPGTRVQIDSICTANRKALLGLIEASGNGISGTVRDSITHEPLFARIAITNPIRWHVYSDAGLGDYHKPLPSGSYTVTAYVQGYQPKTVDSIVVPEHGSVTVDFSLSPDTAGISYIEEMVWLYHADPHHLIPTHSLNCLGPPDGRFFSLGRLGQICVSSGQHPISNLPGDDITVFDSDTADGYWLYAGNDWNGPWSGCGHSYGTASFDLGLDSAHYLRIVCDSTGSSSNPLASLDLDAVAFRTPTVGITRDIKTWIWPNPVINLLNLKAGPGSVLKIVDTSGRLIQYYRTENEYITIDLHQAGISPGVYLAILQTPREKMTSKLVFVRNGGK